MLKPKDLAKMPNNELRKVYLQACLVLVERMNTPTDVEQEPAWYDAAEAAWQDVKRCHQQLALRRSREWASRPLKEIMEDLHGVKQ